MTVEILSLSGKSAAEAARITGALLDIDSESGPNRLERLLVLDDTALLGEHAEVYPQIENSNRVEKLLCVTVGPRADGSWKLSLPGNLGGNQGTPVLWVSRPAGIDWRVAKAAKANRHAGATVAAVDHQYPLIKLLVLDEVFDKILEVMEGFPHRAASPGLWLAGADDEAATFAGGLAVAIRRVCEPGAGLDGPFWDLLPDRAGGARLAENGPLARHLGQLGESDREIARALDGKGALGGMLRRGDADIPRHVARVGEALTSLRDLVDRLLREAHVPAGPGELEPRQRSLVRNAGLEFEAEMVPRMLSPAAGTAAPAPETLTYRALAGAIRGGDSIPQAGKRLMATEQQVARHGSDKYRPRVAQLCPQALTEMLAAAPRKTPRGDIDKVRGELGLDQAKTAAQALSALIIDVANREWSPTGVTPAELVRVRAALDGTGKALAEYARGVSGARSGVRAARAARLGESLLPVLRELVLHQVAAELAAPSANGPEALRSAQDRAAALLTSWAAHVQAHGVTALPSFAGDLSLAGVHSIEEDVATVREALLYPAREEMWQLCAPGDLSALDVDADTVSIRFASRLTERALAGLPGGEPVWTSSGTFAGQLRLVQLRAGVAESTWGTADPSGPHAAMEALTMADMLRFRKFTGEKLEIAARVDDLEAPAGEFLTARTVWLADGTPDGLADGLELRQHRPVSGDHRAAGYARLDSEVLAGRLLHQVAAGREYPPELARLYGDEATSAEPYALLDPYRGESLRDIGAYLSADFDQFTAGLLTGLCWLAGAGIAHRSISPDTVLWDSSVGQVQITDFSRSAPFGIARTPLRGPEAWISPESRPDTCAGIVGPTDDVWGAVRLLYYVRSNGNILTRRDQLAELGLAETFGGMLDQVIGPPEGRPTARDLIVEGMRRPHLLPGVADSRKSLIAGRAKFLNARGRKYRDGLGPPVPEDFWDDVVWPPAHREAIGPADGTP